MIKHLLLDVEHTLYPRSSGVEGEMVKLINKFVAGYLSVTPEEAAKRELLEESGAISINLIPLCDYCGEEPGKNNHGAGMVFCADIHALGLMPESEMAETALFDKFPENLTYPEITRCIINAFKTS